LLSSAESAAGSRENWVGNVPVPGSPVCSDSLPPGIRAHTFRAGHARVTDSATEPAGAAPSRLAIILATGFGSGYSPFAPGTAGTLVAVPLAMVMPGGFLAQALFVAAVIKLAVWSAHAAAPAFGLKDPGQIVVDEIAGYLVTIAMLPAGWPLWLAGFVAFRFFDIVKPPPCRRLEALPGGLGIVADDLMAGLYANLSLRILCATGILSL
jgi:phosphatidylglycerophosphatase A